MELVYLWVEEYKNIENQGFNFSPRFKCDFDGENLTIDDRYKNKEYISIFPDNINITAIVGKNGSGKSHLFEFISGVFTHKVQYSIITISRKKKSKTLVIDKYYIKNKLNIISNKEYKVQEHRVETKNHVNYYQEFKPLENNSLLYYTSSPFDKCSIFNNYSNFIYLGDLDKNKIFSQNKVLINQVKNTILYIKDKKNNHLLKEFDLPAISHIVLIPIDLEKKESYLEKILEFFKLEEKNKEILKTLIHKNYQTSWRNSNKTNKNEMKNFLYLHIWINTIYSLTTNNMSFEVYRRQIDDFIHKLSNINKEEFIKSIIEFFKFEKNLGNDMTHPNEHIHEFIDEFIKISTCDISDNPLFHEVQSMHSHFFLEIKKISNNLTDLFSLVDFTKIFDFWWLAEKQYIKFSSGEIVILDILAKLSKIESNEILSDNIFIMFDEIEMLLHPQWQKKYFSYILKIIDNLFPNKHVHIVLNTHSPFILSDIPKENIVFLNKEIQEYPFKENKQTFGSNIHTLLSDSFFMEDGLMGEFAKGKIEEIKKFYELVKRFEEKDFSSPNSKSNLKHIFLEQKTKFRHIQSIIGEPFLQTVIKNYLDELEIIFNGKKQFLQSEIKRLQELESGL